MIAHLIELIKSDLSKVYVICFNNINNTIYTIFTKTYIIDIKYNSLYLDIQTIYKFIHDDDLLNKCDYIRMFIQDKSV